MMEQLETHWTPAQNPLQNVSGKKTKLCALHQVSLVLKIPLILSLTAPFLTNHTIFWGLSYLGGLSQITLALRVGRWSEKRVVYFIKSAN